MSGYTDHADMDGQHQNYWGNDNQFDTSGQQNFGEQPLNFQSFDQQAGYNQYSAQTPRHRALDPNASQVSFLDPPPVYYGENMYPSTTGNFNTGFGDTAQNFSQSFEDEPPLLEELGINPERIIEKTIAALNPFHSQGLVDDVDFLLRDADLAGPLVFCLALGSCLLFGGKVHFGYIYGLALTCCLMMYGLLTMMTNSTTTVTMMSVASILGYCILPIVGLSAIGVFFSLRGLLGIVLTLVAILWCSLSSSRLFVTMLTESEQRLLIAYPCALLYTSFALIAIF